MSMAGIYVFFIATYAVTLPFVRLMPSHDAAVSAREEPKPPGRRSDDGMAWVDILAIVVAYINIGAYWSNIELAAEASGLDGAWAGQVISWCVLLSAAVSPRCMPCGVSI